jgi:Zn-dependent protease with chaperone function
VAGLCLPSYLWLEPVSTDEEVGLGCLAIALLGITTWGISIWRGLDAGARSFRYIRHCQRTGRKTRLPGERAPVWVMDSAAGVMALTGIVHGRIVVSQTVVHALSSRQLAAALRHEGAHRMSHDNLKRLLILLSPGISPFFRGFEALERGWARFAEWAADDLAVDGSRRRSLTLAAALVRVARLGRVPQPPALATSLLADSEELSARVDRLLRVAPRPERSRLGLAILVGASLLTAACLVAAMLQPATLGSAHRVLEQLVR